MENRIYCAVSYNDNSEQVIHAISFDKNSIKEYINGYKSETLLLLGIIFTDKKDVYICSEQGVDKCTQMCYNKDTEREVIKMTVKEIIEIFEMQIANGKWDEDDEVFVRDDNGVFDTVDFFLKDSDGDIRIYSV